MFVCRPICLLYYWDFLTNFLTCFLMTTIWRPLFDAIQNSIFRHLKNIFQTILYQNVHCGKRLFPVNDESATLSIFSLDLHLRHDSRTNNLGYCGLCVDISLILEFWTKIKACLFMTDFWWRQDCTVYGVFLFRRYLNLEFNLLLRNI